jgi:hypothetical protein
MRLRVARVLATSVAAFGATLATGADVASASTEFGADLATGAAGATNDCTLLTFGTGAGGGGCVSVIASTDAQTSAAAPVSGVLVSWAAKSSSAMTGARLRVMHDPAGTAASASAETVTYSGASEVVDVPGDSATHSFATRLPITQGDLIGLESSIAAQTFFYRPASGSSRKLRVYHGSPDGTSPGEGMLSAPAATQAIPPLRATIEPDADHDGFGDETQDQCASDPSTQGQCFIPPPPDTTPPETTITKGPKAKTTSKTASFQFASSEAGSSFECSLDGSKFAACTSPHSVKAKKPGKHNFQVRARDAAGNVDPSEATFTWKVKKKKKHHG